MPLYISASIKAKPGRETELRAALDALVEPSRRDRGCLFYDLHTDNEDPSHFFFFEGWEDKAAWLEHMEAPHLARHRVVSAGMVESAAIHQLAKV